MDEWIEKEVEEGRKEGRKEGNRNNEKNEKKKKVKRKRESLVIERSMFAYVGIYIHAACVYISLLST